MERLIDRVCGLDVHKQTVAACVSVPGVQGTREQQVRTFGTTAAELLTLRDWLEAHGVTDVAMESTGVTGSRFTTSSKSASALAAAIASKTPRYGMLHGYADAARHEEQKATLPPSQPWIPGVGVPPQGYPHYWKCGKCRTEFQVNNEAEDKAMRCIRCNPGWTWSSVQRHTRGF